MRTSERRPIAGIFVGGRALRMGGRAKGLLVAPATATRPPEPIVERWRSVLEAQGVACVLVGARARAEAYAATGLVAIDDAPGFEGPLAGLVALFDHAREGAVVSVACDMPYVEEGLVAKLLAAPDAPAVAPRPEGRWQPFFARWDVRAVESRARAVRSPSALLDAIGARELALTADEARALRDWDTPEDVDRMVS